MRKAWGAPMSDDPGDRLTFDLNRRAALIDAVRTSYSPLSSATLCISRLNSFRESAEMRKAWGAPMSDDPGDRLTFDLNRPAAVAAILALIGALQPAIKFAVFPKRLHVDDDTDRGRLVALAEETLRKAKNMITEGIADVDEVAGTRAAIALIEDIFQTLRQQI